MSLFAFSAPFVVLASFIFWQWRRLCARVAPLANIAGPPRASWWKGNFHRLFNRQSWEFHRELYEGYGSVAKLHAFFGDERLYLTDPLALHHIIVKDQYIYEETDVFIKTNFTILGPCLLSTLGEPHKKQRKMLNPVFSLKHMRDVTPILYPVAHQLCDVLAREVKAGKEDINMMVWISRAALEYIGQGALGYSFEVLDETKSNTYSEAVKMLNPTLFSLNLWRQFLPYVCDIGTPAMQRKFVELLPWPRLQAFQELVDTMDSKSREIYQGKLDALMKGDEAVTKQVGMGKDIMSVLLRENLAANEADRLPEAEVIGQMNTFIVAGQDTTTSGLCRIIHQLALNQDVQSKLRKEVTDAHKEFDGDLDYDTLMALPYLDAVIRETLRVFPPVTVLARIARKDIVLPLQWPIKSADGKSEIQQIPLKAGTNVIVSIIGTNRCKRIWGDDADQWKPERWLSPLPKSVAEARLPGVYASMMTFNGGGRSCIGFKFAELEMKLALFTLLQTLVFAPGAEEILWNIGGLQSPTLKGSSSIRPQLPLKVSFVQS